ncbi:Phosducin-like protein [Aduncisulcus paluster]|uniref:Phosducin-like protein n=1 Tax=Aduncisulcus paluster TaxID=2918883 RepID=A0ABQ5K6H8_9EUKA|nr:Phosducin-like protein [Aduncisulcus paluster]
MSESDSFDDFLADDDFGGFEAARRAEIHKKIQEDMRRVEEGRGEIHTIVEKAFIKTVSDPERCLCHFFHPEFAKCKMMDDVLAPLARKHPETKFIRIDAVKAPFFVTKLSLRVLPAVVFFVHGTVKHKFLGFEDMGGGDAVSMEAAEAAFVLAGAIDDEKIEQMKMDERSDSGEPW